jgi:hypothetical protein
MALYSTYFDERGHPDRGSHLVVAGAVADIQQWVHFEREWREVLKPHGVSVFHANEFYQRKNPAYKHNPFKHFSDSDARHLIELLAGIICRRVEKTVCNVIPLDQYRAANEKYLLSEHFGWPYPAAARSCMTSVSRWAERHSIPGQEIMYFFEDGAKHKGQLEWLAEKDKLPRPRFEKKADIVPLQAGDFIAWHIT